MLWIGLYLQVRSLCNVGLCLYSMRAIWSAVSLLILICFADRTEFALSTICYLCALPFNETTVLKHGEHVLQNALGGGLLCDDILCQACGGKLGNSVDGAFAIALSPLTTLLDTPRDRGAHSQTPVQLHTSNADAKVLEQVRLDLKKDFSLVPARPVLIKHDAKKQATVVAATIKQARQYARSPAVQELEAEDYGIQLSDNAASYAERLLLSASPDAPEVLRGILKIAIGFASLHGVERKYLAHLMTKDDLIRSESELRRTIFPYYPVEDVERLYETEKHVHEDWYPTHHLYLYSHGRDLYCYVELFGVLQKYVHLSGVYDGPSLIQKFVQKAEKWEFEEIWFTAGRLSDLHVLASQFGVSVEGRAWTEIQDEVLHRARTRSYSLEPDDTIKKVKWLALELAQYVRMPNAQKLQVVREMFEKAEAAKTVLGLTLLDDLRADPLLVLNLLRMDFNGFRIGTAGCGRPDQARRVPSADLDRYVAYKFYELLRAKNRELELEYRLL